MNKLAKYLNAAVLGALIVIEGTSKASAAVIYSQTFNGGPGGLVTTTPTTGAGTWTGDNIISRNGELAGGGVQFRWHSLQRVACSMSLLLLSPTNVGALGSVWDSSQITVYMVGLLTIL